MEEEHFYRKIIFSDEAHFDLGGFDALFGVFFWAGGIIEPFFFEDAEGKCVTVNGERYRAMLTDYLWPIFEDMDLDKIWLQQDSAPCHTSHETIDLLRGKFENRVISLFGDMHYYLWGAVKDECYANHPASIEALKKEISAVIGKNCVDRIGYCKASRGSHLNAIVFHNLYFVLSNKKTRMKKKYYKMQNLYGPPCRQQLL